MQSEPAMKAAVAALSDSGWIESTDSRRPIRRGFQSGAVPTYKTLCHGDVTGAMSIVAYDRSSGALVSYALYSGSQDCSKASDARSGHDTTEIMARLPILRLPDNAKISNTGMGGNGDEVNTTVDISSSTGRAAIQSLFEEQILNQGWEFQTNWSSRLSSGSVWTMTTPEDGILIGTLHIFDSGTDPTRVRFSLNPADPTKGEDRGSWSSTTIN